MTLSLMVNGQLGTTVSCSDRGFQYGDGVFTSTLLKEGVAILLGRHLERLARDCDRLLIPFPGVAVAEDVRKIVGLCRHGVLKIQVTRGSGGRGYRPPEDPHPTRVLGVYPTPHYDSRMGGAGVVVRICRQRLSSSPALAGVKHMNRLEQILARSEWDDPDIFEGLMMNRDGDLIEGTMSNVFVVRGGTLITPKLDQCGVAGVMRGLVLDVAAASDVDVRQQSIGWQDLIAADEIVLTNSVMGVIPVRQVESHRVPLGPVAQALRSLVDEAVAREVWP